MSAKHHKLILTDGTVTVLHAKPSMEDVKRLIGSNALDFVTLNRSRDTLMLVDDSGMIEGKPVNAKATSRYLAICKPGTTHQIHGHVVILNDTVDV